MIVNAVLNSSGGVGAQGTLTIGGGVNLNSTPVLGQGNITLQGNGLDLTLGNLTFNVPITFDVNRYIIVDGALTTTGANSNISLIGDAANTGTGGVWVTSTGSITSGGAVTLAGSSLNGLVGVADPNAGVEIDTGSSINAAQGVSLTGKFNANLDINGTIQTSNAPVTLTTAGTGSIQLGNNIVTNGGAVTFNSPATLTASSTVDASSGTITFNGITGPGYNLTLQNSTAASGTIFMNGNVAVNNIVTFAQPYQIVMSGASNTIGSQETFNNTNGVVFAGGSNTSFNGGLTSTASTTTINGSVTTNNAPMTLGTVVLAGNSTLNSQGGTVTLGAISGPYSATISAGIGQLLLNGAIGDPNSPQTQPTNLTLSGGTITVNANVNTTGLLSFSGNTILNSSTLNAAQGVILGATSANQITLNSSTTITTNNASILFNGAVNGPNNLILNAGPSGNITVNAIMGALARLNSLQVINANNVTMNAGVYANSFIQAAGSANTVFASILNTTGTATITTHAVYGNVAVGAPLILNVFYSNLTGTVGGANGANAVQNIILVNSVPTGVVFFNGIDLVAPAPVPVPPTPNVPSIVTAISTVTFPSNVFASNLSFYSTQSAGLNVDLSYAGPLDGSVPGSSSGSHERQSCVNLGGGISMCSAPSE